MNKQFCEAVEIVEIVEYADPGAPNGPGRRAVWDPDRTEAERTKARKAGARFFWAIAGHSLDGRQVPAISETRQELMDLCDFLNAAMGWHHVNITRERMEKQDSTEYGVSLWLEKSPPGDDMEFTYGVQVCSAPDEPSAMELFRYAETVLEAALKHPRAPKDSEDSNP